MKRGLETVEEKQTSSFEGRRKTQVPHWSCLGPPPFDFLCASRARSLLPHLIAACFTSFLCLCTLQIVFTVLTGHLLP